MSYPDNPPLSAVGGGGKYTQFVVPTFEIPPTYEKITPVQRQILEYVKNGNAEGIRKMAETPSNQVRDDRIKSEIIDCVDENGWTPIKWAIKIGHVECITALYEAGADTNKRSLYSVFSCSDVEYELNSLLYATILVAENRIGIECVSALLKRRRGQEQTERNYIVEITFKGGIVVKSSALTFVIQMANQQLRPVHLPLIKLLLDNRVNIRDDDFIQFNIQRPEVLKLLLDRLRYDTLHVTDLNVLPFLPNLIKLKYTHRYKPVDSEKRKESARLLLDFYTSEELVKRREELGAEPEKEEAAAPVLFWHAIRYKVPEFVEQCIEENIPFYKGNPIYMSGPSYSWDILRKVLAYREQRGENIKLSEKLIVKIIHNKNFLVTFVDVDVLTGFGVPADSCKWGNKVDHPYHYSSHITKVLPRNLEFALKHGFDLKPPHNGFYGRQNLLAIDAASLPPILVHVNNQTEFTKAFFFMKNSRVIIDLGGKVYRLPKADIDDNSEFYRKYARIQNGRVVDASDNVPSEQAWAEHFTNVQISEGPLPFKKGDIVAIQQTNPNRNEFLDISRLSGELEETPYIFINMNDVKFKKFVEDLKKNHGWKRIQWKTVAKEYLILLKHPDPEGENTEEFRKHLEKRYHKNKAEVVVTGTKSGLVLGLAAAVNGWYRLVGHTKPVRAGQGDVSFCDIPAAHVIMNAQLHESNLILLGENDIDKLNFKDDYWSAQTAETLGEMTWGSYKGEDIIHLLLDHPWNQADKYKDRDVFNIFQRFVEQGAFVPNIFCQALLDNAQWFPIVDAINIYDKLRANCPGYIFGKDEQREFDKFADRMSLASLQDTAEQLKIFEHVLEVENSGEDTYFPNFPLYIPKLCDIFQEGKVYEPGAYLATFLIYVHAKDVPSAIVVDCINRMLAAGFDINYNQHPDIRIPLFYVLDNGNELVLAEFLKHPDLDINQNVNADIELTALESLMININDRATALIMIHKMLQDDRVECPFHQHTLPVEKVDEAPEIVDLLLHRKYFGGPPDKPREWYFDPNTVPLYKMRDQTTCKQTLEDQGVEPQWQDNEDDYTKTVRTNMPAAAKVVHWRGLALQHLSWRLRKMAPVVRFAVRSNGLALQFVTARHMMSWDTVQDAVVQNWRAFQFLPMKAIYERVKEPVPFKKRQDVKELQVYSVEINNEITEIFEDASKGVVHNMEEVQEVLALSVLKTTLQEVQEVLANIKEVYDKQDLDTLVEQIVTVASKIRAEWDSEPYEYRGLPSQSEPGFVVWMRHLFQEGGPHEGQWPEFKEMFPEAVYAEMNPDTHEGQKEIEEEKSPERKERERKEREKEPIKKMRDAIHVQLGEEVTIVHWDDFEPVMFS